MIAAVNTGGGTGGDDHHHPSWMNVGLPKNPAHTPAKPSSWPYGHTGRSWAYDNPGLAGDGNSRPVARDGGSACKGASCATGHWKTSGHIGRSSFSGEYRLRSAPCGDFRLIPVRDLRGTQRSRRSLRQRHNLICRSFTGATGLEPATSGVTNRATPETHEATRHTSTRRKLAWLRRLRRTGRITERFASSSSQERLAHVRHTSR